MRRPPSFFDSVFLRMCKFSLTPQAAPQVLAAAHNASAENMFLRVTGRRDECGAVIHGMGFDELRPGDLQMESQGVKVVITPAHAALLDGTVLDFVQLNTGGTRFVFVNPNDDGCATNLGGCGYCDVRCRPAISCH